MNKKLIIIIFLSVMVISGITFRNFFLNDFVVNNFIERENIEVFDEYKENKIGVCYGTKSNCKNIPYKLQGSVNTKRLGTYTLTYRARYKEKELLKKKKVSVVDTKKPELIIEGTHDNVCPNGKALNVKYTAKDNYDGDISKEIKYKLEGNKIIYKVSDSSGNITKKEYDVTIKDDEAPKIILDGGSIMYLKEGSVFKEPGYVAIDNCDGDITDKVKISGKVENKAGEYELTYEVLDSNSNKTTIKRIIKVYKNNSNESDLTGKKVIYLTFDDGPGAYTERLLQILSSYNVKATFFVVGSNNTKYDYLITKEHEQGHTVGLHSYTHKYDVIYSSDEAYFSDLNLISEKVKNLTGIESKIIRFPGGSSNTISKHYSSGIMSRITNSVEEKGYRYFDWTIMSGDAGNTRNPNKIFENVTNGLKEDLPNVILMHDIKSYTVDSIERIIQYGLSNGYTFAALTVDSPIIQQNVLN